MPSGRYLYNLYSSLGNQRHDFRNANLNRLISQSVTGDRVLDVGCGSGALSALMQSLGKSVLGIEPNHKLVELARRLHPGVEVVNGDGADIARLDERFDTITIVDVLEHIEDDLAQLRLLHERLCVNGTLIVIVPQHPLLFGIRDRNNGHFRRYTRKELLRKLDESGFHMESARSWNFLGVLPYFVSERVFRRELNTRLRSSEGLSFFSQIMRVGLNLWFRLVENRMSFGCGLSLFVVAKKVVSAIPCDAPDKIKAY